MEQSTKLLGGIAYIFMILFAPLGLFAGPVGIVSLAAAVCVAVAFVRASHELAEPAIKSNIMTAVVLYIVSMVLIMFLFVGVVSAVFLSGPWAGGAAAIGVGSFIGGLVGWVLAMVAAWFWYKASRVMADATGEKLFRIGGLLLFIGALTLIVFGIGAFILLFGQILQCIGFFTVTEKATAAT